MFSSAFPEWVSENEPLAPHLSLGVGGPARWLARPRSAAELADLMRRCRDLKQARCSTGEFDRYGFGGSEEQLLEKGEILIRDEYEREEWDWRKMAPIDVEGFTKRLGWLMEQKSPGDRTPKPVPDPSEETPQERLDKAIRRKGQRGLGPDAPGYGAKKKPGG